MALLRFVHRYHKRIISRATVLFKKGILPCLRKRKKHNSLKQQNIDNLFNELNRTTC